MIFPFDIHCLIHAGRNTEWIKREYEKVQHKLNQVAPKYLSTSASADYDNVINWPTAPASPSPEKC